MLIYEHVKWYFSFMSTFLQLERQRLGISAANVVEAVGGSRATYTRWEAGSPVPSDKLTLLSGLGFDVQYIVTGVRSNNLNEIANKPEVPHFDFEGKLSVIVKVLEEVLNDLDLDLNPKVKGEVVEMLLMQAMLKHTVPTKNDIYPVLKLVA